MTFPALNINSVYWTWKKKEDKFDYNNSNSIILK